MKALVLAAALAALSSATLAGAEHNPRPQGVSDTATATLIADAGRLGSASVTAFNGSRWTPAERQTEASNGFEGAQIDTGSLLIALGVLAMALYRPVSRALRRQEQQRRATALASTLNQSPQG
ncbi:MAG: hypothetical protein HY020_11200 [Burkholderiales bacterium]|nr:hypothetical protein [Burkholderiales bacterium]